MSQGAFTGKMQSFINLKKAYYIQYLRKEGVTEGLERYRVFSKNCVFPQNDLIFLNTASLATIDLPSNDPA